jgi:Phage integrase family
MGRCGLREPLPAVGQRQNCFGDRPPDSTEPASNGRPEPLGNALPGSQARALCLPAERYGAAGNQFCAKVYDVDPSKPIGSIKEAWEAAKSRAGRILKGVPEGKDPEEKIPALVCRFHDLRHTAVSRMLNAGTPIAKVAKIVGWSPATMVRMAARYGHFSLNELRGAMPRSQAAGTIAAIR